ncbi:hypothetical protein PybrP1_011838 [[Pythium] brassicae (nom. inval.)]|nr:hypothetical protein PybrP1_011838 [[Pythium] brassicae (nom. inval.)]
MYISYIEGTAIYTILGIVCIASGLTLNVLGYRFYRFSMVASGFFAGGDYTATFGGAILDNYETENQYWTAFSIGGVLVGFLAALHPTLGTAITGFVGGVQVAFLSMGMASYTGTLTLQVVWASVAGVICAGLILLARKPGLAAATSFVGAMLFNQGVSHFVNYKIFIDSDERTSTSRARARYLDEHIRSAWWTMNGVTLGLFAFGVLVQLLLTARGINFGAQREEDDEDAENFHNGRGPETPPFDQVLSPLNSNAKASRYVAANPIVYA